MLVVALSLLGCATQPEPVLPLQPSEEAQRSAEREQNALHERDQEALAMAAIDNDNSVYFALGSAKIDPSGEALLRRHAERLIGNPKLRVTIVGHTDDLGSRAYNIAVAEKRVAAVFNRLKSLGVKTRQMQRYSAGSELTSDHCRSRECRRLMRRVELRYAEAR
jgi:outer membrane protein OmpA-like peptidoglycan-associated protein